VFGSLGLFGGLGGDGGVGGFPESIRQAIYNWLANDSAVWAICEGRVYYGGLPQDPVYPCVSLVVAGRFDEQDFDGAADLSTIRVRLSAWSPRLIEAERLATAIRGLILPSPPLQIGDVRVENSTLENEFDMPERPETGDDEYLHQVISEYRIWFRANQ